MRACEARASYCCRSPAWAGSPHPPDALLTLAGARPRPRLAVGLHEHPLQRHPRDGEGDVVRSSARRPRPRLALPDALALPGEAPAGLHPPPPPPTHPHTHPPTPPPPPPRLALSPHCCSPTHKEEVLTALDAHLGRQDYIMGVEPNASGTRHARTCLPPTAARCPLLPPASTTTPDDHQVPPHTSTCHSGRHFRGQPAAVRCHGHGRLPAGWARQHHRLDGQVGGGRRPLYPAGPAPTSVSQE
jgi:hypothetical protein